jgi:hypothetical protein
MCYITGKQLPGTDVMILFSTKGTPVLEPARHLNYKVRKAWSYSSTTAYAFRTYAWALTPSTFKCTLFQLREKLMF